MSEHKYGQHVTISSVMSPQNSGFINIVDIFVLSDSQNF